MRPNNNASPWKAPALLLAKILVIRLGLSAVRYNYDDSGIVLHVNIRLKKTKKSNMFEGPISMNLKSRLPKQFFLDVIEIRMPDDSTSIPMLGGTAKVKSQMFVWTLEPLTSTLVVRTQDGHIKVTKERPLIRPKPKPKPTPRLWSDQD